MKSRKAMMRSVGMVKSATGEMPVSSMAMPMPFPVGNDFGEMAVSVKCSI